VRARRRAYADRGSALPRGAARDRRRPARVHRSRPRREERARECVGRYEEVLKRAGVLTDEHAEAVRKDAEDLLRAGIRAAEAEPPPDPELLFRNAYVDPPENLRHG